jgi:hypothetical protein
MRRTALLTLPATLIPAVGILLGSGRALSMPPHPYTVVDTGTIATDTIAAHLDSITGAIFERRNATAEYTAVQDLQDLARTGAERLEQRGANAAEVSTAARQWEIFVDRVVGNGDAAVIPAARDTVVVVDSADVRRTEKGSCVWPFCRP